MAATAEVKRCKYCWRPADYRPQEGEGLHNKGCPADVLTHVRTHGSPPPELKPYGPWMYDDIDSTNHVIVYREHFRQWQQGYRRGWDDEYIPAWRYRLFSPSFLLGYHVGKSEIDAAVDEAAQSRYFG